MYPLDQRRCGKNHRRCQPRRHPRRRRQRVLLLDLDSQPTLSSYFSLATEAPGGIYELIALNDCRPEQVVSRTVIPDLDLILSNDDQGKLATLLLHAPDGRLSLTLVVSIAPAGIDLLIDPAFK